MLSSTNLNNSSKSLEECILANDNVNPFMNVSNIELCTILNEDRFNNEITYKSPEIIVGIMGNSFTCLIDSGSDACVVSSEFIERNEYLLKDCSVLPVSSIRLKTACNRKTENITKQILIPIILGRLELLVNFLIVKNLLCDLILGADFLFNNQIVLDFSKNNVKVMSGDCVLGQVGFSNIIHTNSLCFSFRYIDNKLDEINEGKITNHICRLELHKPTSNNNSYRDFLILHSKANTHDTSEQVNELETQKKEFIDRIHQNTNITTQQKDQLLDVIHDYRDVFSNKPGRCNCYEYELKLKCDVEICKRSYPIPYKLIQQVDLEINKMVQMGIIREEQTPYISPCVIVNKEGRGIRICLDARKVNENLQADPISVDRLEILLQKCKNIKYISSFDFVKSFWQIKLTENSRKYTGFQHRNRSYTYEVIPFGLKNSLSGLLRALSVVLGDEVDSFTLSYVDDLFVMSSTYSQHISNLRMVLERIKQAGMTLSYKKSNLLLKRIKFLGFILDDKGISTDPDKVKSIREFPIPKNRKNLKQFLGLCQFYEKFIYKYSGYVQPLLFLTSKTCKWVWTDKETEQFEKIKDLFLETVVLHHVDIDKDFYLQCDASAKAISGILFQKDEEQQHRVICFMNRTLNRSERMYGNFERECLAIIWSLRKIRGYIIGSTVHIITDNQALTHLTKCRLLNARLTKWFLELQCYNFTISHCKGSRNQAADTLSRNIPGEENDDDEELKLARFKYELGKDFIKMLKEIKELQDQDSDLKDIVNFINSTKHRNKYKIENGVLLKKVKDDFKILVPKQLIKKLIWQTHLYYGHISAYKVHNMLYSTFTWKKMHAQIRKTLATCYVCQTCKYEVKINKAPMRNIIPEGVDDLISIDIIGELPVSRGNFRYIFTIVNCFSKFVKIFPLKRATTLVVIKKLDEYFKRYGYCKRILSDHGTQFTSLKFKQFIESIHVPVQHIFSSIRHASANPVERYNKTIVQMLRIYVHQKHATWIDYIQFVEDTMNHTIHDITLYTPNFIQTGEQDIHFWDKYLEFKSNKNKKVDGEQFKVILDKVRNRMTKRGKHNKEIVDRKCKKFTKFQVGSRVLLRANNISVKINRQISKFFKIFEGPYMVSKVFNDTSYEIVDNNNKNLGVHHVSDLKAFIKSDDDK